MDSRGSVSKKKAASLHPQRFSSSVRVLFWGLGFPKKKEVLLPKKLGRPSPTFTDPISEVRGVGIRLALGNHREIVDIKGLGCGRLLRSVKAQILRIWRCLGTFFAGCFEGSGGEISGNLGKMPNSYAQDLFSDNTHRNQFVEQ